MSNERINLKELEKRFTEGLGGPYTVLQMDLISELKRCYEVMNEVILRAMDARETEASDIIKHGDEEYIHVNEITYPFSKSDIDAALDSKASE